MAAVEQFQVNTADYSAEYGRAAGGVINTVTKSGTNTLNGEIFFFERNSSLGAVNPFTTLTAFNNAGGDFVTSPYKPPDVRRQIGFAIGGPIVKDRLFWFYSFDDETRNFPSVSRVGLSAGDLCAAARGNSTRYLSWISNYLCQPAALQREWKFQLAGKRLLRERVPVRSDAGGVRNVRSARLAFVCRRYQTISNRTATGGNVDGHRAAHRQSDTELPQAGLAGERPQPRDVLL